MADRRELTVGGKPLSSLRVVDLKVELEKRSLPKSGSKKDLLERLRLHLQLEENREAALRDEEHVPNLSLCNETENDFIKEYLAAQQARFQVQREAKKQFEEMKRESEASAEETTQDEDEPSEVSPSKKTPRKANRPRKKEEMSSTPQTYKSSLEFQTPESIPYSTPPQDKHEEDSASQDETTGEDEELKNVATPLARKHKLLKYVEPPAAKEAIQRNEQQSKQMEEVASAGNSGTFSVRDHVEKYQAEKSTKRDPPPSTLYEEAINLKVDKKELTKDTLSDVSSSKAKLEPSHSEQVFPRVLEVWSENKNEPDAAREKLEEVKNPSKTSGSKDESMVSTSDVGSPKKISETPMEEVKTRPKRSTTSVDESKVETAVQEKVAPVSSVSTNESNQVMVNEMEVSQTRSKIVEKDAPIEAPVIEETPKVAPVVEETPLEATGAEETPKEVPVAKEIPMEVSVTEEIPKELPVVEKTLKEVPVPEETPLKVPTTEETPIEVPVPEEMPMEVPVPEETPMEVPVPEETPMEVPVPKETPMEVPIPEETPLKVPTTEETPKEVPVVEESPKEVPVVKEMPKEVPVFEEAPAEVTASEQELPKTVTVEADKSQSEAMPEQNAATDLDEVVGSKPSDEVEKAVEKEEAPLEKESSLSEVAGVQEETICDKQVVGKAMENKVVPVHSSVGDVERSAVTASSLNQSETRVTTVVDVDDAEDKKQNVEESIMETKQNLLSSSSPKDQPVMAIESETLTKLPKPADQPVDKISPSIQDPSEDMEEDELQMESGETIEDSSLKLNITELDECRDHDKPQETQRSRCSSRSRNSSGSSSDQERSSATLNQSEVQAEAKPQVNNVQVSNVGPLRKLKVRRSNTEAQGEDETKADVGNGPSKRRKWGTSQLLPIKKPALVISTDSLKSIVPDARPLTVEEVRLGSPNAVPKELRKPSTALPHGDDETLAERVDKVEQPARRIPIEVTGEGIGPVKPELVLAAAAPLLEATSPAQQPRASVLHVSNLVRPFTINQLKDLLARTGNLVDGKFWIDKVKSSCLVQFETEEEAEETRGALHGIHWPTSNPKTLVVDYSTVEDLENRLSGKELSAPQNNKTDASTRSTGVVQPNEIKRDKAERVREWDLGKVGDAPISGRDSPKADASLSEEKTKSAKDETPAKLLDDLFRKTKTSPCIYWLPLTAQQIAEKQNMRRQRQLDRDQRISDIQQKKDQEFQQRQRERERQRDSDRQRQRERQRSRKRSRSSSSSSSSSAAGTNKRRSSKTPPRKR